VNLYIAGAVGRATTELAAFDRALIEVGAANFNLIRLSSVIPFGSTVVEVDSCPPRPSASWGDRLYTVYAEQRTSIPGVQVWAGVGWVQDPVTGRGLFVEHEGDDESAVRRDIVSSLGELQAARGVELGPMRMRVVGAECTGRPTCALVLCAYETAGWSSSSCPDVGDTSSPQGRS